MEKLTLTVSDIQQALCIGKNQAYSLCNRADFPSIRIGRKLIVPRDAFIRWLDKQTEKAEAHA